MRHLDLFSGIGGFALATEMAFPNEEIEHIFCDNDPFSQAILRKNWPNAYIYGDIKNLTGDTIKSFHTTRDIDLLTGGFPCQPFSAAGRRKGTDDDRHLWPEMLRVIRETHPRFVLGENVGGLLTWDGGMVFEMVCTDLESEGYEVGAFVIPACAVNAPHRRDRVWIAARNTKYDGLDGAKDGESDTSGSNSNTQRTHELRQSEGTDSLRETASNSNRNNDGRKRAEKGWLGVGTTATDTSIQWNQNWPEVAAALCRVDDGLPRRLDRTPRLKALGNAIVPQVAAEIISHLIN